MFCKNGTHARQHRNGVIAVVSDRYSEYHQMVITPLAEQLRRRGFGTICVLGRELNPALSSFDVLGSDVHNICQTAAKFSVDGYVILGACLSNYAETLFIEQNMPCFHGLPVVNLGCSTEHLPSVAPDSRTSMHALMQHMTKDPNRNRFVFIKGNPFSECSLLRESIFRSVLAEKHIAVDEHLILGGNYDTVESYNAMCKLLQQTRHIDAVVAANDLMAIAAVTALRQHGLMVPDDVIVSGHDNVPSASERYTQITSIDQNYSEQARQVVELLLESIHQQRSSLVSPALESQNKTANKTANRPVSCDVETKLIVRESSEPSESLDAMIELHRNNIESLFIDSRENEVPSGHFDIVNTLNQEPGWLMQETDKSIETGSDHCIEAFTLIVSAAKSRSNCTPWVNGFVYSVARYLELLTDKSTSSTSISTARRILVQTYAEIEHIEDLGRYHNDRKNAYQLNLHSVLNSSSDMDTILSAVKQFFELENVTKGFVALNNRFFGGSESDLTIRVASLNGNHELLHSPCYPATELLPSIYLNECQTGLLTVTPLSSAGDEYGFLIIEPTDTLISSIEPLAHNLCLALSNNVLMSNLRSSAKELERKNIELTRLANTDSLTGLNNRAHFDQRLKSLTFDNNEATEFQLFLIDLDNFKNINDSFGHEAGDDFLSLVAEQISRIAGPGSFVARLGGDEFAVIQLIDGHDETTALLAAKYNEAIAECSEFFSKIAHVSASIGTARYPGDGQDAQSLLKNADVALYSAKADGKNRFRQFDRLMSEKAAAEAKMAEDMRLALEHNEFQMYHQPRYQISTGKLTGFEALMRWIPKNLKEQRPGPDVFIALAEKTGFIHELGAFALAESCKQAKRWQQAGHPIVIAVNLSVRQLQHPDIVSRISSILQQYKLPANLLEIEVTETAAMTDVDDSIGKLTQLRDMGIEISLDDFGTGYSSMNYLKKLPVTNLKIDRSFLNDVNTGDGASSTDSVIVKAVVALGHNLGFKLIAEGVETEQQLQFLDSIGCHEAQGYLFSPPVDSSSADRLLLRELAEPA